MEYVGEIEKTEFEGVIPHFCEPHSIALDDGTILVHIRAEGSTDNGERLFTIYQSKSFDGGRTFTKPVRILDRQGGQLPTISEFFIYIPNYCKKLYLRRGFKIDELYSYNNLI